MIDEIRAWYAVQTERRYLSPDADRYIAYLLAEADRLNKQLAEEAYVEGLYIDIVMDGYERAEEAEAEVDRLRTALALRSELYDAAVWAGYYESDRKRPEYRAALRMAREIMDKMDAALVLAPATVRETRIVEDNAQREE